jgi:hypothetical protein
MPVSAMKTVLTRAEFNKWVAFYKFKQPDETEIQLAILSLIVSQGLGNKKAKLDDFLINKQTTTKKAVNTEKYKDTDLDVMTGEAVKSVFGMVAVKKG